MSPRLQWFLDETGDCMVIGLQTLCRTLGWMVTYPLGVIGLTLTSPVWGPVFIYRRLRKARKVQP